MLFEINCRFSCWVTVLLGITAAAYWPLPLAGPSVQDPRLITAVANYWKQDALLQLLLHAVRLLMQLGPAMSGATAHGVEQQQKQPGTPEAATEEQQQDETASAAVRTVGLPELLTAMQELGKVGWHNGELQQTAVLLYQGAIVQHCYA